MGEDVLRSFLRSKLSSILTEAKADSGSPSHIISRFRSIETQIHSNSSNSSMNILYELIEMASECRVFSFEWRRAAVSKKGFGFSFPKRLLHPLSELMFHRRMKRRLDSIEKNITSCTTSPSTEPAPDLGLDIAETHPIKDTSLIIGFEEEAGKIEARLMSNQEEEEGDAAAALQLRAVGIVGRCGCGKTALAQKVFNSPSVKKEFSPRIWVSLSKMLLDDDRKVRVVNHILREIDEDDEDDRSLNNLMEKLQRGLRGKRYLIVLDDAWRLDEWYQEFFSHGLPRGSGGGAVIVTSRRENVIRRMIGDNKFVIRLRLSDEFCWQIFTQVVRRQGESEEITDQNLRSIQDDVARNVDGLPLVAKTFANIVRDSMLKFKSYWITARGLHINGGDDTRYWRWFSLPPPQETEEEVGELLKMSWLKIIGTVELKKLLLDASYSAYLVFKLSEKPVWLHLAMTARVRIICDGKNPEALKECHVFIDQKNPSQQRQLGGFPQLREGEGEGGWMEIKLGDFFTPSRDDDGRYVEVGLLELKDQHWKSGLLVKGMELRWNVNG